MTEHSDSIKIAPSPLVLENIVDLSHEHPVGGWPFINWPHGAALSSTVISDELQDFVLNCRRTLRQNGFVVISCSELLSSKYNEDTVAASCTLLVSAFGIPLRVFLNQPHWRKIQVDLERPPERSGGAGLSPLHMDFVNADNPPDVVCLLCLIPDPMGGGASLLSRIAGVENALEEAEIEILSRPLFSDGVVKNLAGVGNDANPFPVLSLTSPWKYRFTSNLLSVTAPGAARDALEAVARFLATRTIKIMLRSGDLLILDQHQMTHGRAPVGPGQENLSIALRRTLMHSFVRYVDCV